MPSHRRSAFPSISQEFTRNANRKSGTPVTVNSPTVKCPMVRPQRYRWKSSLKREKKRGVEIELSFSGLHGPGWLYLIRKRSRGYSPDFATLNPQNTHHGARPGPKLTPWCSNVFAACSAAESTERETRLPAGRAKNADMQKKKTLIDSNIIQGASRSGRFRPLRSLTRKDGLE